MDWVEDSTQWVWNAHMSLEWRTWVQNDEDKIDFPPIKQCQEKHVWI